MFGMHIEFLRAENVRHVAPSDCDFSDGRGALRRWTRLPASEASDALLRCLALASLGRRQTSVLAPKLGTMLGVRTEHPALLEYTLIYHAPQERGPHRPARRQSGWQIWADGHVAPLSRAAMR